MSEENNPLVDPALTDAAAAPAPAAPPKPALPPKEYVTDIMPMSDLLVGHEDAVAQLSPNVGDVVTGTIVSIERGCILVDLGSVTTAIISGQEVADAIGSSDKLKLGDDIEAVVIDAENDEGQVVLSLRKATQEKAWQVYQDAFDKGEMLSVEVGEANKGGLLMEMDGIRGFIPVSQLTPEHYPRVSGADPEKILSRLGKLVGEKLTVKILSIDPIEKRMILSEKAAYVKEREEILKQLTVGEVLEGRVSGIVNFGVFVNYKGVEGLVHISEIAWGHVGDPNDVATIGDDVQVKVIGIEGDKVSFSIKRLTPDPWIEAVKKYHEGQIVEGEVARFAPFGVFIRLAPEVDGLVHTTELGFPEGTDPQSILEAGQKIHARIKTINLEEHRVDLSLRLNPPTAAEEASRRRPASKPTASRGKKKADEEPVEDDASAKKGKKKRVHIIGDEDELP